MKGLLQGGEGPSPFWSGQSDRMTVAGGEERVGLRRYPHVDLEYLRRP
jgi:hypothetical protein